MPEENTDDVVIRSTISEEYTTISCRCVVGLWKFQRVLPYEHMRERERDTGGVVILSVNSEDYSISQTSRVMESSNRVPTCEYVREDAD